MAGKRESEPKLSQVRQHPIIRIVRLGLKKGRFTKQELLDELGLNHDEYPYLGDIAVRDNKQTSKEPMQEAFVLMPNAVFSYIELMELRDARKEAKRAHSLATTAIALNVAALILAIALSFGIAEVRLVGSQFKALATHSESAATPPVDASP